MPRAISPTATGRSGYTLLEILLVLTVLTVVAGIAWPRLDRLYAEQQLKQAAEELRIKLSGARLRAIDAGVTYECRYEPGGRRLWIVDGHADVNAGQQTGTLDQNNSDVIQLPEEIRFGIPNEKRFPWEQTELPGAAGQSRRGDSPAGWSVPLLFYPDGSANDMAMELVDDRRQAIRVSVRGLTGAVSLSPLRREAQR